MSKTKVHPTDLANEAVSTVLATDRWFTWLEKHENVLKGLVLLYRDDQAEELLGVLRESFWGGLDLDV